MTEVTSSSISIHDLVQRAVSNSNQTGRVSESQKTADAEYFLHPESVSLIIDEVRPEIQRMFLEDLAGIPADGEPVPESIRVIESMNVLEIQGNVRAVLSNTSGTPLVVGGQTLNIANSLMSRGGMAADLLVSQDRFMRLPEYIKTALDYRALRERAGVSMSISPEESASLQRRIDSILLSFMGKENIHHVISTISEKALRASIAKLFATDMDTPRSEAAKIIFDSMPTPELRTFLETRLARGVELSAEPDKSLRGVALLLVDMALDQWDQEDRDVVYYGIV